MAKISDSDIQATACSCSSSTGAHRPTMPEAASSPLREQAAHTGAETWEKIAALVEEWQREERIPHEGLN